MSDADNTQASSASLLKYCELHSLDDAQALLLGVQKLLAKKNPHIELLLDQIDDGAELDELEEEYGEDLHCLAELYSKVYAKGARATFIECILLWQKLINIRIKSDETANRFNGQLMLGNFPASLQKIIAQKIQDLEQMALMPEWDEGTDPKTAFAQLQNAYELWLENIESACDQGFISEWRNFHQIDRELIQQIAVCNMLVNLSKEEPGLHEIFARLLRNYKKVLPKIEYLRGTEEDFSIKDLQSINRYLSLWLAGFSAMIAEIQDNAAMQAEFIKQISKRIADLATDLMQEGIYNPAVVAEFEVSARNIFQLSGLAKMEK